MTARRLLQIVPVPDALLDLTPDELAWALLEDMQAREHDQTAGMANRDCWPIRSPPSRSGQTPSRTR